MRYRDARAGIATGDLILFEGKSWISRAIRAFTRSNYSHSAIAYRINGRLLVVESIEFRGVTCRPLSTCGDFVHVPLERRWTANAERFLWSSFGARYDYSAIWRNLIGMPPVDNERYICSEFCWRLCRLNGVSVSIRAARNPRALADAVLTLGRGVSWHIKSR